MITVGIVDDNAGVRKSFERLIAGTPGFRYLYSCASGEEALRLVPSQPPDVLLMDIDMPGMSGIECVASLKQCLPSLLIIMVTVCDDDDRVFQALRAGACGYMLKRSSIDEIRAAIAEVVRGGAPMSGAIARKVVRAFSMPSPGQEDIVRLSPRERELLNLISTGISNKEAAVMLKLTISTVREYLKSIYDKLHVHCRTDAVIKYLGRQTASGRK